MKFTFALIILVLSVRAFGQQKADSGSSRFISDFRSGFVDTFSIKNYTFRIIAHIEKDDEGYSFEMQKLEAKRWTKQFNFGNGAGMHEPEYNRKTDYNGDGYNDLICYSHHDEEGFIFDTIHGQFIKNDIQLPYEWKVIDTAHYLFCSLDFDSKLEYGISLLYTFRDFKIYPYYYLKIEDNDDETAKVITLYKCLNGDVENLARIMQKNMPVDNYDFYTTFWEVGYKDFMHYK